MKQTLALGLMLASLLLGLSACGRTVETNFYVEGACEACQEIIEQRLLELPAVSLAEWSFASSQVRVIFNASEIDPDKLQAYVSEAGFQTTFFDANPAARSQLPSCCQEVLQRKLEQPQADPHSAHP
ncbi:MAG: heavy-metal-associated domain-containing protein [Bacteroidota bacterium]